MFSMTHAAGDLGSCWTPTNPIGMGCAESTDTPSPGNSDVGIADPTAFLELYVR